MAMTRFIATLSLATSVLSGCADFATDATEKAAYLAPNLWQVRDIPVCFAEPGTAVERATLEATLRGQRSWANRAGINFIHWSDCTTRDIPGVRIRWEPVQEHASSTGPLDDVVTLTLNIDRTTNNEQFCVDGNLTDIECRMVIALHEFGHAVGFAHEFGRTDKPVGLDCTSNESDGAGVTTYGPYDARSIMTQTCSRALDLSPLDLDGAVFAYGLDYASVRRAGDYDGDGSDDRLCHNAVSGEVRVGFGDSVTGPKDGDCHGDLESLYVGEFTASGRSERLCHDRAKGDITLGSFGEEPRRMRRFCAGPERHLLVGDFNGDGRDDLLCHDPRMGVQEVDTNFDSKVDDQTQLCAGDHRLVVGNFDRQYGDDLGCYDPVKNELTIDLADASSGLGDIDVQATVLCGRPGQQLLVGDWNGDGADDLLCHSTEDGSVSVDLASGSALFGVTDYGHGPGRFCFDRGDRVIVGDYDGDGIDQVLCHNVRTGDAFVARPRKKFYGNPLAAMCTEPGDDLH